METIARVVVFILLITKSSSVNITCSPEKYNYDYPVVNCCVVKDDFNVSSEYEQLTINDKSNKFNGFLANQKSIAYLPKGIEKCCATIEVLMIKNSSLKDITSTNLQSFPDVVVLYLSFNKIQILEAGLFDRNLKIEKLYLNGNQISAIVPTAFDKLTESSRLFMDGNNCYVKTTSTWITIQQYKISLMAKNDCIKDENIKMNRLLVKVEKFEANFQYIYSLNREMIANEAFNLKNRLQQVESDLQSMKKINSENSTEYLTEEDEVHVIHKTSQNEMLRKYFFIILIALTVLTYFWNFILIFCIFPRELDENEMHDDMQQSGLNNSVRFDPQGGVYLP